MARFWLGVICLLIAALCAWNAVGFGIAALVPGTPKISPVIPFIFGTFAFIAAIGLWVAELRTMSGDDPFAGKRGMLIAMMVIALVAVFGLTVAAFVNGDAWRGFFDGLRG